MKGTKTKNKNKKKSSSQNQINAQNQKDIKAFINNRDSEWYIIGKDLKDGPYNDFCLYSKLYEIYYECFTKNEKVPNYHIPVFSLLYISPFFFIKTELLREIWYILNNKKTSEFTTLDDCFEKLDQKFGSDLKKFLKSPLDPISELGLNNQNYFYQMPMFPMQVNFMNNMYNQLLMNNNLMYNNIMYNQNMMNNNMMMNNNIMNNGQIMNNNQIYNNNINGNINLNNINGNNDVNNQNNNDTEKKFINFINEEE